MQLSIVPSYEYTPQELATMARLRYVSDDRPGFTRRRRGKGFIYYDAAGRRVTKANVLERLKSLVIPPAWKDVWICPQANGHLQVTGKDDRKRKQYLYHPRWSEVSNRTKFKKLIPFGSTLPRLRPAIRRHAKARTLTRDRVAALLIELLDRTLIRIGNEEYARSNNSFGLTTLHDRHVTIRGATVEFCFRGKSGKQRTVTLKSRRLARLIAQCQEVTGRKLFQFVNGDGRFRPIGSGDVNEFLQQVTGQPFTAKDFRMWKATALVVGHLYQHRDLRTKTRRQAAFQEAICIASDTLGNTRTVCRTYYVHPGLLDSYLDGSFQKICKDVRPRTSKWLSDDEQILMQVLQGLESPPRRVRKLHAPSLKLKRQRSLAKAGKHGPYSTTRKQSA